MKDIAKLVTFVIGVALFFTLMSSFEHQHVCNAMMPASLADGVGGPLQSIGKFFSVLGHAILAAIIAFTAVLVISALGLVTWIVDKILRAIGSLIIFIRDTWFSDPTGPVDEIIARDANGNPLTVKGLLMSLAGDVEKLQLLTSGLEPPPPPKTAEELLREELEAAKAKIARLQGKETA